MRSLKLLWTVCGFLLICAERASSQAVDAAQRALATNGIMPTVTRQMGDVGGKYFGEIPDPGQSHHYYIAAEPAYWDYAPQGQDPVCGKSFPPSVLKHRQGSKTRYVQYTDGNFETAVRENPSLGIMGPVLRGKVGEYLAVTFLNRTGGSLSMHPHGVKYDKDSEGSYYQPRPGLGAAVGRGARFTYVWYLDESSGPLPGEPSSKAWLYHSHVTGDEEVQRGLMGCIIVTDPKRCRPDGSPNDVDRELATLYMIFDESGLSPDEREGGKPTRRARGAPAPKSWSQVQELREEGARYSINGYIFGNLPGLEMNEGERVRWYVFGLGSEEDFHTAHWHGLRVIEEGRRRTDVVELLPASMKVVDMVADNVGTWLLHCHVAEHMQEGMFARVVVHPKGSRQSSPSVFLGLGESVESLQFTRADAPMKGTQDPGELKLAGSVTVIEALPIYTTVISFQIGSWTIEFKPDKSGKAIAEKSELEIKNANSFGVVHGGLMEFEATLSGADLPRQLKQAGFSGNGEGDTAATVPITMSVGKVPHSAAVHISVPKFKD